MNIFVLSFTPRVAAQMHCDKHVSKMILESAQMLCTVLWSNGESAPYKAVHARHPCTVWAAASLENWQWLRELATYLNEEFCWRYGRTINHKSMDIINSLSAPSIESKGLQQHPQCMPNQYKSTNPVTAYRNYYIGEKHFARWTRREIPTWYKTPVI